MTAPNLLWPRTVITDLQRSNTGCGSRIQAVVLAASAPGEFPHPCCHGRRNVSVPGRYEFLEGCELFARNCCLRFSVR